MIEPGKLLILFSLTIALSYFSSLIYTKTKIPDLIWLLGFGILLGPILGVFDKEIFIQVSPLMGIIALNIITFGAGIETDIEVLKETLPKSAALTLATFTAIVLGVGLAARFLTPINFTLLEGMLLGTMVAGISTVAIIGLLDELGKMIPNLERARALLTLESTIVDPIRIVIAITIIRMMMKSDVNPWDSLKDINFTFIVASILGVILGVAWAIVLSYLRGRPFNYMLTLAILFPVYFLAEKISGQGGGIMAAFTFGLVLANYRYFTKKFGMDLRLDRHLIIEFNSEISFFLKSYYFVYIGLIVTLSQRYMLVGLGITILSLVVRYIVGTGVGHLFKFSKEELVISRLSFTLGTSALVMSQLPIFFDPQGAAFVNPEIYPNLVFPVVLGTVIFTAIAGPTIARRQLTKNG